MRLLWRRVGSAFSRRSRFDPISDSPTVDAEVRVAEFVQQGDRLLVASSCELPAVYGDLGGEVGKQLARANLNLLERNVDRARDVRLDV